jgi:hypothetical protein
MSICARSPAGGRLTRAARPPGLRAEHDGDCTCVADDEVVWASTHDIAVSLEELVGDDVLVALDGGVRCPKARHTSEDGAGVLGERVERRKPVEGDGCPEEQEVQYEVLYEDDDRGGICREVAQCNRGTEQHSSNGRQGCGRDPVTYNVRYLPHHQLQGYHVIFAHTTPHTSGASRGYVASGRA